MNFVYLIGNKSVGLYKIGVARVPQKRLKSNQTSCPFKLETIHLFESKFAYKIEKIIQQHFSAFKKDENENDIQGEWFCFGQTQIDSFLIVCQTHEKNFDILISMDNHHFKNFLKK